MSKSSPAVLSDVKDIRAFISLVKKDGGSYAAADLEEAIIRIARNQKEKALFDVLRSLRTTPTVSVEHFRACVFEALKAEGINFAMKEEVKEVGGFCGNTALLWGIANANNDCVSYYLEFAKIHNLDIGIDLRSAYKNTALHLAVVKGYEHTSKDGDIFAVSNLELIGRLIDLGANVNIKDSRDFTALDLAVIRRHIEMVETIIKSPTTTEETIVNALQIFDKYSSLDECNKALSAYINFSEKFLPAEENFFTKKNNEEIKGILDRKILFLKSVQCPVGSVVNALHVLALDGNKKEGGPR